ncbi:glycoside hydrolase family 43 protein, partial [Pleomassaria siparia CBS 279.74]
LSTNFPDPDLFEHNGTWFAFATNSAAGIVNSNMQLAGTGLGAANVQLATSTDLNNWTLHNPADDPLPTLGDWVANGTMKAEADPTVLVRRANVWAPDVLQRADGSFVLYYAAAAATVDPLHCVGAATSDELQGPYKPLSTPLACPTELGGAIDPASIIDADGTIYVAYKVDGNAKGNGGDCGNSIPPLHSTPILLQKMEKDGVTVSGTPTTILDRTDQDGPLVEAPGIIRSDDGVYFLFFSSGCTRLPSYDLKYATSQNIAGPYTRASEPLLKTGDMGLSAPGSASVRRNGSGWLMAFHARINTNVGGVRAMYIATLNLNG